MEAVLGRKPLTPAERAAPPARVCVTGAAGYISSTVVCRLLAAGHTVHATYRAAADDAATVAALKALPGAAERLHWFEADLLKDGSFDTAVAGCKYVIHMAAPFFLSCPESQAFTRVVNPTVRGVVNVLGAVSRAGSVERVVMTSSIVACMWGIHHADESHVVTEADWNVSFSTSVPYSMAKNLSEWEAWAIHAQQSRWELVVINPAVVMGPPLAGIRGSEIIDSTRKLLDGSSYPFVPPLDTPAVDIADVAAAHCLAMVLPGVQGRYIICERATLLTDIAAILRQAFPTYWVPYVSCPYWLASLYSRLSGMLSQGWLHDTWGRKTQLSSRKALRELSGLGPLISIDQSVRDMASAMIDKGLLPDRRPTPKPEGALSEG